MFLIALSPLFWALFEQTGSSLNMFTDQGVDRTPFGWTVPASVFQLVNAAFIILLAPVFAGMWTWLARRRAEPSVPLKFGIGLCLVGLGFPVLVGGMVVLISPWVVRLMQLDALIKSPAPPPA